MRQPSRHKISGSPRAAARQQDHHGHHALTDAIATAELLQAQVAGNYGPETPIGMLWS